MDYNDFTRVVDEKERGLEMQVAFPALMRKVYGWMALALVITGLTSYLVASSPGLMQMIFANRLVFWGMVIAEFAIVFVISGRINRLSLVSATTWFVVYSVLNGALLSFIFMVYTQTAITEVFFITAGTFGAMALIGSTTKRDLTKLGGILFMALIGLIIASVVNFFVQSNTLDLIVSYVGVLIFVGLTAWDAQQIKRMLAMAPDAGEGAQKIALLGALNLYLDFINLFLYLLRIFGGRDD
ncbi:MAG: Bax inhibitor-1/YccA family protein [Prevotella sp.]|uniref:Bax inhibitor-1/YccA family protein n=1 Tax=Prevotella sp. TaxID=59823 RepID=UPI00258F1E17|nr:Bax inhibitor-1/YccA family protein [Prevotella sp.]MDD6853803.1 Bax inhibitor-1/YccA family protein [Prevotella sp.]